MRRWFVDDFGLRAWAFIVAMVVGCVAAMGVFVILPVRHFSRLSCERKAEAMGREWRYSLISDCLVRVEGGRYVPLENYRLTDQEMGK